MVSLAASEQPVVIRAASSTPTRCLLNVANGTLELRSGQPPPPRPQRPHHQARARRLQPRRPVPALGSFLTRVTGDDQEPRRFLQRLAGYTITGSTDEEILAFPRHGPGATGNTAVESIKSGARRLRLHRRLRNVPRPPRRRRHPQRHRPARRRPNGRLSRGRGRQTPRRRPPQTDHRRRQDRRAIPPPRVLRVRAAVHPLAGCNARPRAHANDDALWRRILQVPFTVVIPPDERDPELKRALRTDPDEQQAILAWLVQGCLDWQHRGLDVPDRVRDYTAEYRQENDPLADWIADDCQLGPDHWTATRELRDAYERWCNQNGVQPITATRSWGTALKTHGCEHTPANAAANAAGEASHSPRSTKTPDDTQTG